MLASPKVRNCLIDSDPKFAFGIAKAALRRSPFGSAKAALRRSPLQVINAALQRILGLHVTTGPRRPIPLESPAPIGQSPYAAIPAARLSIRD